MRNKRKQNRKLFKILHQEEKGKADASLRLLFLKMSENFEGENEGGMTERKCLYIAMEDITLQQQYFLPNLRQS